MSEQSERLKLLADIIKDSTLEVSSTDNGYKLKTETTLTKKGLDNILESAQRLGVALSISNSDGVDELTIRRDNDTNISIPITYSADVTKNSGRDGKE